MTMFGRRKKEHEATLRRIAEMDKRIEEKRGAAFNAIDRVMDSFNEETLRKLGER
jgi:hypothetical protein